MEAKSAFLVALAGEVIIDRDWDSAGLLLAWFAVDYLDYGSDATEEEDGGKETGDRFDGVGEEEAEDGEYNHGDWTMGSDQKLLMICCGVLVSAELDAADDESRNRKKNGLSALKCSLRREAIVNVNA